MKRVVVTGMGAVTPIGDYGLGRNFFWENLLQGKSGVSRIVGFPEGYELDKFAVRIAAQVKDFNPEKYGMDSRGARSLDKFSQFALAAAKLAVEDANLETRLRGDSNLDIGIILGVGIGGLETLEEQKEYFDRRVQKGDPTTRPMFVGKLMPNAAAYIIAKRYGIHGETATINTACASGTSAQGYALRLIREGYQNIVFTGGADAVITRLGLGGFIGADALSKRNDAPEKASRPFDRDRDGFVMGEGAGILVFEELEHAVSRHAHIHAEVLGFGATSDAGHITQPHEEGLYASFAISRALRDSSLDPEDIDYVNAHGTATELGDVAETKAIRKVFGRHANRLLINSTKSMIGHLFGAAGAVEAIATIKSLEDGVVHQTINLNNPGEGCDLNYAPNKNVRLDIRSTISNSFGFGGHNAVIAFKRWE